jgi:Zn-dependent M28 family amino/carboxypeptidase
VEVSGAERTTFYPVVESLAKTFGLTIRPDAHPEAGHYYRSDHFSMARVGVPAFSVGEGLKFKGHDTAWAKRRPKITSIITITSPATSIAPTWILLASP